MEELGIAKDLHVGGSLVLGGSVSSGSGGATQILDNTVETNTIVSDDIFVGNSIQATCDLDITAGCDIAITGKHIFLFKRNCIYSCPSVWNNKQLY